VTTDKPIDFTNQPNGASSSEPCETVTTDKPIDFTNQPKWGFKLRILCDSNNGYTYGFSVNRGKKSESVGSNGLGYDVVMIYDRPQKLKASTLHLHKATTINIPVISRCWGC
jgi:hypothetical protein